MHMKIDKFDCVAEEQDKVELDMENETGVSLTTTTVLEGPSNCFHLGAPEKNAKPLSGLTGATKFSISHLPCMLEDFLNRIRTQGESYYRVQRGHMVSVLTTLVHAHRRLRHV